MKKRENNNYEDVDKTIKDIREEKIRKKNRLKTILMWVFIPFTGPVRLAKYLFSVNKTSITTKTTIIFTSIFGILIVLYVIIVMTSFSWYLGRIEDNSKQFLTAMWLGSALLATVFLFIGYIAGALISKAMLRPIRRMSVEIDQINSDNLSKRLDYSDSQDELTELVHQINNMLDSLEQSFTRQSNFIADASHELKTPIAVINGYSNLLRRWGKEDCNVLDEGLDAIARESSNISKIIDQLLMLAKIGRLNITRTVFSPATVVEKLIQDYRIVYGEERIIKFESIGGIEIETDKNLLIEAIRTLVDNALKYSTGEIEVRVMQSTSKTLITIKDYGQGISQEDLPHIFDRFYRSDKTRSREKGSAGLGLTICRSIIEMLGGEIRVSSEQGVGTEATILIDSELYAL